VPTSAYAATGFSEKLLLDEGDPDVDALFAHPRMCIGPNNIIYIIWVNNYGDGKCLLFTRSLDGGISFEKVKQLDCKTSSSEPRISANPEIGVADDGTIFIFYSKHNLETNQITLILKKSENEGAYFDTQTLYTEQLTTEAIPYAGQRADIKITENGIYYVWNEHDQNYLTRSTGVDNSFETIKMKPIEDDNGLSPNQFNKAPSVAIDSNNNLYVVWKAGNVDPDDVVKKAKYVYSAKLDNGNNHFSEYNMAAKCEPSNSSSFGSPSIVTTTDDNVFIFYNIMGNDFIDSFYKDPLFTRFSNDGGSSFSEPLEITFGELDGFESVSINAMAKGQNDVMHFAYLFLEMAEWTNGTLYYSNSSDSCNSFSTGVKIADLVSDSDMCLNAEDGTIYVVWDQSFPVEDSPHGVYFSRSIDLPDDNSSEDNGNTDSESGGGGGCFIGSSMRKINKQYQAPKSVINHFPK
jgi:hypothetical protein